MKTCPAKIGDHFEFFAETGMNQIFMRFLTQTYLPPSQLVRLEVWNYLFGDQARYLTKNSRAYVILYKFKCGN